MHALAGERTEMSSISDNKPVQGWNLGDGRLDQVAHRRVTSQARQISLRIGEAIRDPTNFSQRALVQ